MRPLRLCVLGGSGFVGTHLCGELVRQGHTLTIPTRVVARARHLQVLPTVRVTRADVHDEQTLTALLAGQDAVINLVGILNESGRDGSGFRRAHIELARKLVAACRATRTDRLLQMSGLNADPNAPSHYLRSKGEAERIIRDEGGPDLAWTLFKPSVLFGPGDSFINRFAGLLASLPALPLARPEARLAPVWVGDVVSAMTRALADPETAGESYELCGPEVHSLRDIVAYTRDTLGLRRAIIGLPDWAARLQAAIMDFVPGKPFSTDNYRSLGVDSVCRVDGFARLGIRPSPMRNIVPGYLGGLTTSLDQLRQRAGRG